MEPCNLDSMKLGSESIPLHRDSNGTIRVGETKVTLESVAYAFEEGDSAESIQDAFPGLQLSDIYLVLGFCLRYPAELEEYLAQQRLFVDEARREDESRFQTQGLRNRLLSAKNRRRSA